MSGSRRLKSAVIMKKRLSSIVHGRDSSSDEDLPPAAKDKKETKGKEEESGNEDRVDVKDSDSKKDEDSNSGIELITSSEDEDGPSQKRQK